ncbi:MAG: hypothetical protein NWS56_02035 [Haliea sp.]|jgi:hypothetical protein|nr:hypothetical protein [Haliea sp.]
MLIGELGLEMFFSHSVMLQFMWSYRQADNMDQAGGQVRLSKHF